MDTKRKRTGFNPWKMLAVFAACCLLAQAVPCMEARAEGAAQSTAAETAQEAAQAAAAQAQAAAVQAQAEAVAAAHLEAYQKAQEEYAAQLAAYQQALLAQQAAAQQEAYQQALLAQQAAAQQNAYQQALLAQQAAAQQNAAQTAVLPQTVRTDLAGKKVSILGDSISTYEGYTPAAYTDFYPRESTDVKDVSKTWWMQVLNNTGMSLLVNGSWSASAVCGDSRGESSSAGCSNRRLTELMGADGTVPDVILVYMGANDFFHSYELGTYSGVAVHRTDHYILNFTEAYELMLQKLQALYPNAEIYCMTLTEANSGDHPRVNARGNTIADFNSRIKAIAAAHGVPVIDVHNCGMEVYELNYYTSDGTHPNAEGAKKMADYVTNRLLFPS